jgi:hypothetical protein
MKTKIISKTLLSLGLAFVLVSAITQVRGGDGVVTIHSTSDVTRRETGSFVLDMNPAPGWAANVNFSVSGTAIPGVDYVALTSPVPIIPVGCGNLCWGGRGYGVIGVKTLPDLRGSFFPQACSVVVTLEPGFGYAIGEPSSATIWINP